MKTMYLEGTLAANSSWTRIAQAEGEAGKTKRIREIRLYADVDGVYIRLFLMTELVFETSTTASRSMNLPYPADFELKEGQYVALEANNPTSNDVHVIVELVYEE